jgi:hypothetical protein
VDITGTAIGSTLVGPLKAGDNRYEVPSEAVAALIFPPSPNGPELRVRTNRNEADAGLPVSEGQPSIYSLPASAPAVTTLIVHSSAACPSAASVVFV